MTTGSHENRKSTANSQNQTLGGPSTQYTGASTKQVIAIPKTETTDTPCQGALDP